MKPDPIPPGETDVCAVCGTSVARHPEWLAEVIYDDGTVLYFDGPRDLFHHLRDPGRGVRERRGPKIEAAFVTAYYDRAAIPVRDALYVLGSDVVGPRGGELVPHGCREDAEEFLLDHHGQRIVSYDDVSQDVLARLD